jgi:hypothetical protein
MGVQGACRGLILLVVVILGAALLAPGGAVAATVVNGGFETGSLNGWHAQRVTGFGDWYPYAGTAGPIPDQSGINPLPSPPDGKFAAVADELNPDTTILWQDVRLEPNRRHQLNLTAFYETYEKISIPAPDSLSVDETVIGKQVNQQFRIDVIKPEAALESLAPEDILATVFETREGDPRVMAPTRLTAGLNRFAGQTVRLRLAVAAEEEAFLAGVDAISISTRPLSGADDSPSNQFHVGKARANRRDGSVLLPVRLPGPGSLTAKRKGRVATVSRLVAQKRTLKIRLRPTPATRKRLQREHRLRIKVAVTYKPTGGTPRTKQVPVVLQLRPQRGR